MHKNNSSKKAYRAIGGGRKPIFPDVRTRMYDWFIDIRGNLKGRLPRTLFKSKCQMFYDEWLSQQKDPVPEDERPAFFNQWTRGWMQEYGVFLRKPNKRYQINHEDRVESIEELLLNIWRARKYFLDTFNVEIPIINGGQMQMQCIGTNVSHTKELSTKGDDVFVKENYPLSRERVTAYTQYSLKKGYYSFQNLLKIIGQYPFCQYAPS